VTLGVHAPVDPSPRATTRALDAWDSNVAADDAAVAPNRAAADVPMKPPTATPTVLQEVMTVSWSALPLHDAAGAPRRGAVRRRRMPPRPADAETGSALPDLVGREVSGSPVVNVRRSTRPDAAPSAPEYYRYERPAISDTGAAEHADNDEQRNVDSGGALDAIQGEIRCRTACTVWCDCRQTGSQSNKGGVCRFS